MSRLAQCVAAHGVGVRVFGLADEFTGRDLAMWGDVRANGYPRRGPGTLGLSPGLSQALTETAFAGAVIHVHGLWKLTSLVSLRVSRKAGVPRMVSPHGMLDRWALEQSALRKRLAWRLYEAANMGEAGCLHALCDAEVRQIRDFGLRNPVAVIPNGMDLPAPAAQGVPTPATQLAGGRKVLLFLSRIHPKKGLIPLVRAWSQCAPKHLDWLLVIAGPDEDGHQEEVRRLVTAMRLGESVAFVGAQYGGSKVAWLHAATAFVLPSFSEGFPVAILEALAYGLPVLMTPFCNFPEAESCGAALSVGPEPTALADGLEQLMSRPPAELRAMGGRGRELIGSRYAWDGIADRMVDVYRWLLGQGDMPDCVVK